MNPPDPGALARIRIVLVRPRSPGNVGSVARAMKNFGFSRLVLVDLPEYQDPEFFPVEAGRMAWKAADVLSASSRVPDLETALEGTVLALGTTHRSFPGFPAEVPEAAATRLLASTSAGGEAALVFGGEANGLEKAELAKLAGVVTIPTGDPYPELNLAQAAAVLCWELFRVAGDSGSGPGTVNAPLGEDPRDPADRPARFEEVEFLANRVEARLREVGFLEEGRPARAGILRRVLARSRLSCGERDLLLGALAALGREVPGRPTGAASRKGPVAGPPGPATSGSGDR